MTTARKPRAAKPPADDDTALDFLDLDSTTDVERSEFEHTEPLFRINGTTYEARTQFTAGEGVMYAKIMRTRSVDEAIDYAMILALGEEGWNALLGHPYLSLEKWGEITRQVTGRILPVPDPK